MPLIDRSSTSEATAASASRTSPSTSHRFGALPGASVYPGVMMIEAMAQTAGVIGIKSVEGTRKPRAVYFLTIDKCKFRKPVMPGDTIEYHMRSIGRRKTMWWFHGDAKVNGVTVAEADVGAMLTD
jgi:3-hydroxyacyl-[acyl-carrier-protein] dehydratase